jgi:tetratricopeptide (TPR) repeat protein
MWRSARLLLPGICTAAALSVGCLSSPEDRTDTTTTSPSPPASLSPSVPTLSAPPSSPESHSGVRFTDVHAAAGLRFRNVSGSPEQRYILESISAGIASFDYDGDGYQDLFVVDGNRVEATPADAGNRLYRNEPAADNAPITRIFREVTAAAGLSHSGWGMGCAVGDVDNDGDPDLYVTYWGPDLYYRNDGDGTFVESSAAAGLGSRDWGTSAAFGDLDGDGLLDLYVVNYLEFDLETPPAGGNWCTYKGLNSFCGPEGIPAQADRLYRNSGEGHFVDVTAAAGVDRFAYPGLGVALGDFDDDGDLDVYVADDSEPNLLFRNDGDWRFTETGTLVGAAYSENGRAQAGMGVDAGDFDNDGDLDLYVTNFTDDVNTLYQNQGDGWFVDGTYAAGMGSVVRPYLGWAAGFFDYDNDGWLDLFVANGHVYPQLEEHPAGLRYAQRNLLYRNHSGRFEEIGRNAGPGWLVEKVSRAAALSDYDNDGDIDLAVVNLNDVPTLLHNDGGNRNNWLGLKLIGSDSNRDAIGARVTVRAGDIVQVRQVQRGRGFQGQCDPRLVFGLGDRQRVDAVEILWPSGRQQLMDPPPPLRRYLEIREDHHEVVAGPVVAPRNSPLPDRFSPPPDPTPSPRPASWQGMSAAELRKASADYYRQGRYAEARKALADVLARAPDDMSSYVNLGLVLYSGLGRYDEAASLLEGAVRRDSAVASAHHLLGKVYLRQHRVAEAIGALERATRLDPSSWDYENWLGLAHLRAGSMTKAETALKNAARLAPWEPRPHLHLSRVYEDLDLPAAASAARRAFEQLNPAQRKVEHYTRKMREYPQNPRAPYLLGRSYLEQGRWQEASRYFRQAIEIDSLFALAYHAQGTVLQQQNKLPHAIRAYEWARRIDPDMVEVHNDLGQAYHQAGQFAEAIASYVRGLKLDPDLALVHSNLGMAYAMAGRLDDAVGAFGDAIARDSTLVDAHDGLAQVYAAQGRVKEARLEWKTVLRLHPDHPRAAALLRQGRNRR